MTKRWFITGVSTGFGRSLAVAALQRGDHVAGTLRRREQLAEFEALAPGRALAFEADVTREGEVQRAVSGAIAALGHVDVLVNNAGYGALGAVEELSEEQTQRQLEVNLHGALRVTRAFLPHMRARRAGRILQISSVAGQVGSPGLGIYNASKWALEGFSEALQAEVKGLGIRVVIIEPGAFRTDWAGRSMDYGAPIEDYAATAGYVRKLLGQFHGKQPGDPDKAARLMLELADMEDPPLRVAFGADAFKTIKQKLEAQLAELLSWEAKSTSLAFDAPAK
ncbi:oxidoreductase [Polyangium jinanense]|uniref:SDR family NAD(P)-dependent oxidoreductase n=1 Tax=Polyangium jinanense TaxID=2829994 RepID=A0A9X3XI88_9BACT|nr:oxidoreductase [Polyangium jinanense]MDC3961833.1 SDR family NAD(P)-dependent oxidoreductase [Polyangium jinanense]MDC3988561.1 SDR family NAD(P)-dependent oxidoreductase [Polyangium jinanense]